MPAGVKLRIQVGIIIIVLCECQTPGAIRFGGPAAGGPRAGPRHAAGNLSGAAAGRPDAEATPRQTATPSRELSATAGAADAEPDSEYLNVANSCVVFYLIYYYSRTPS